MAKQGDKNNKAMPYNLVKFKVDATLGNKKETPKRIAARIVTSTYLLEISFLLEGNMTIKIPINNERVATPKTTKLIQLEAVKT